MDFLNFGIVALSALIPMIIGFIYYNPKVVGGAWMKATGLTEESMKGANMLVISIAGLVLSFLLASTIAGIVVHQTGLYSMLVGFEGPEATEIISKALALSGDRYLTFGHGALHGTLTGLFLVFPIMATNNMYERKPFKLTIINTIYWTITLAIMGGVLCKWGFHPFK